MMALVTIPYSVGLIMTCGVRVSRAPLKAGCTSQRLESPIETFWISSPTSSSTSHTRRGSQVTMTSVSPYGYWMNSVVRMIGADWPDFQARIAAWTCGSSGWTSSPAPEAAEARSSPVPPWPGRDPHRAEPSAPAAWRSRRATRGRPPGRPEPPRRKQSGSKLLGPSDLPHVQPEGVHLDGVGRGGRHRLHLQHGLPVAPAEQRAVEASLLLVPAHLPRSFGELKKAGDGREDRVRLRNLEGVVRPVVVIEECPRGAPRVCIDLIETSLHRNAVSHHSACAANERGELVAHDPFVRRAPRGFHGLHRDRRAEGVDLDDVRDRLVLQAQRHETAAQHARQRQLRDRRDLPPATRLDQIEIAIVPFAPSLDVRVQILHHSTRSKRLALQMSCHGAK